MFFRTQSHDNFSSSYRHQLFFQTPHPLKLFTVTEDGVYIVKSNMIMLNNSKVAKFNGKIKILKSLKNIVISSDDKGSIKIIKEKVLRRYDVGHPVIDLQFVKELKVAAIFEDSFLRIYEFQDEHPVFTKHFDEKLVSISSINDLIVILTTSKAIFLETMSFKETKSINITGDKIYMLLDGKIVVCDQNKIKVIESNGKSVQKRIHREPIRKIEIRDNLIYSLGNDGYFKTLDMDLNILEQQGEFSYFILTDKIYVSKHHGEVLLLYKEKNYDNETTKK